jgi:hypothetical protein
MYMCWLKNDGNKIDSVKRFDGDTGAGKGYGNEGRYTIYLGFGYKRSIHIRD